MFKNKLGRSEKQPSPRAWGQLQQQLDQGKKKRGFPWWNIAAAVLLVAGAVFTVRTWKTGHPDNQGQLPTRAYQQETPGEKDSLKTGEAPVTGNNLALAGRKNSQEQGQEEAISQDEATAGQKEPIPAVGKAPVQPSRKTNITNPPQNGVRGKSPGFQPRTRKPGKQGQYHGAASHTPGRKCGGARQLVGGFGTSCHACRPASRPQ